MVKVKGIYETFRKTKESIREVGSATRNLYEVTNDSDSYCSWYKRHKPQIEQKPNQE
ncbi:hypothetical protein LXJ15735_27340 [Lacrimispora xylanolytica]